MESLIDDMFKMTLPLIVLLGFFTYLAIASYADSRRKEREAYYRNEFRKKLIEQWGKESAAQVLELLKQESQSSETSQLLDLVRDEKPSPPQRRKESLILAGLVCTAAGIGLCFGLQFIAVERLWTIGVIPALVGAAILIHAFFFLQP